MGEQMEFPETFETFAKEYGFKDDKEVYTNGSDLIPIFRVKQWLEHDNKLRAIETDTAHECGKHANKWIPCEVRLPEENGVYIVSYEDSVRLLEWFNGKWFFYPSNPAREETGTIIAWQPLSKPYKAESEDNVKTYNDIYNEFCEKFPLAEVKDYRPAVEMYMPQLSKGIPYAIIVWLKDGSTVIYISESEDKEEK